MESKSNVEPERGLITNHMPSSQQYPLLLISQFVVYTAIKKVGTTTSALKCLGHYHVLAGQMRVALGTTEDVASIQKVCTSKLVHERAIKGCFSHSKCTTIHYHFTSGGTFMLIFALEILILIGSVAPQQCSYSITEKVRPVYKQARRRVTAWNNFLKLLSLALTALIMGWW